MAPIARGGKRLSSRGMRGKLRMSCMGKYCARDPISIYYFRSLSITVPTVISRDRSGARVNRRNKILTKCSVDTPIARSRLFCLLHQASDAKPALELGDSRCARATGKAYRHRFAECRNE